MLRQRIDIIDVIGGYVRLKAAGANHKGCCPFHQEKTPSFMVSPSKQIYHCFGCGKGGNVFRFIMEMEHLTWMEALRLLADRHGVPVPSFGGNRVSREEADEKRSRRNLQLKACLFAQTFFEQNLNMAMADLHTEAAQYMAKRSLTQELCAMFHLGLAPTQGWRNLLDTALRQKVCDKDILVGAGLVTEQNGKIYDRFRNRIMFPIQDASGRPVAFGGRIYARSEPEDAPKYINSPETELYSKGHQLYAFHLARPAIQKEQSAMLMEGYLDVIRCHQYGFTNAIASCGTALTEQQGRLLRRFTQKVYLVYDGDQAGQKAMLRGAEVLLPMDFELSFVVLPDAHDPDSFLRVEGADKFRTLIESGKNLLDFLLSVCKKGYDITTPEGKQKTAHFVASYLIRIREQIVRDEYFRLLAEHLAVDLRSIRQLARQILAREPLPRAEAEQVNNSFMMRANNNPRNECLLLRIAVDSPDLCSMILDELDFEWLKGQRVKSVFTLLAQLVADDTAITWNLLTDRIKDEDLRQFCTHTAIRDFTEWNPTMPVNEVKKILDALMRRLKFRAGKHKINRITDTLKQLKTQDIDGETVEKHLQSFEALAKETFDLKREKKQKEG